MNSHPPHQEPEKGETRKLAEEAVADLKRQKWILFADYVHAGATEIIESALQSAVDAARREALEWAYAEVLKVGRACEATDCCAESAEIMVAIEERLVALTSSESKEKK